MIVMAGNQTISKEFPQYSCNLGVLYSYTRFARSMGNYALDNYRFVTTVKRVEWSKNSFIKSLERAYVWGKSSGNNPRFVVVPDVPFDAEATNREWKEWFAVVKAFGFDCAFAVQNGHSPKDVPSNADVVFVGGDTQWKRQNIKVFCDAFPRVHVARINTGRWLWVCHYSGAESVDGTGWVWKNKPEYQQLIDYLDIVNGGDKPSNMLFNTGNFTNYQGIKGSGELMGVPL